MPDIKYKLFAERLLLYNITSEPTELTVPILSQSPTVLSYLPTLRIPILTPDCNVNDYIAISAATSVFTTLFVILAAYYYGKILERCKARYLDDIAYPVSSSSSESISSHIIDLEPGMENELFWFEDVYNVDHQDVKQII
jgi:hypothetical protein